MYIKNINTYIFLSIVMKNSYIKDHYEKITTRSIITENLNIIDHYGKSLLCIAIVAPVLEPCILILEFFYIFSLVI